MLKMLNNFFFKPNEIFWLGTILMGRSRHIKPTFFNGWPKFNL